MRKALTRSLAVRVSLAVLLLLPALGAAGASNDWFARPWQSDEGLPDNNVSGIAQTGDGFLWVGTVGGLVRFDGARFDEFSPLNVDGVPVRGIRTLLLDRAGTLWLSMDRGIVVYAQSAFAKALTTRDGLPNAQALVFAEDADDAIWMGFGSRREVAYIKNGKVTTVGETEGVPGGQGWITADNKGQIWLAKGGHLSVFKQGKFQEVQDYTQTGVVRIAAARSGGVWVGSGARIWKYKDGGEMEPAGELPPGSSISALMEDHTGALWIGTLANGLFRKSDAGIETMPSSHLQIECVFEGHEGTIWVGTYGGGLDRLRPRAVELLGKDDGLPFESIRSVCQDSSGKIWIATLSSILARSDEAGWSIVSHETNWPGGIPVCVASDASGGVWIGTSDRGLINYQNGQYKNWRARTGLLSEYVHGLLITGNGDVWITYFNRLQRLHQGTFESIALPTGTRYLRALAEDSLGNIWCGTSEGRLFCIRDKKLTDETDRIQGGAASIRCLSTTSDGAVWIGYADAGLGRYKGGKYARITMDEGLHENSISQIVADKWDHLWMAGNGGIFQVSMPELSRVADDVVAGRKTRVRSVLYGRAEGLHSLQPTYDTIPSATRSLDGRIWMAMRTGSGGGPHGKYSR